MRRYSSLLATILLVTGVSVAEDFKLGCQDPVVRQSLKQSWERMAKRMNLPDSTRLQLWNLRDSSDFCRADFVATRPGVRVGGVIAFKISATDPVVISEVGKPKFTLYVHDSLTAP